MRGDIHNELSDAISRIDRPGSFCVSGSASPVLPGLEVDGLGPIGLPLTVAQAKQLIERCHQAPHGKGEKTVVDTSVRRVWRLEPPHFSLRNPEWDQFLDRTVAEVQEGLGLEGQKLSCHLYDLLLYEKGSFFMPHRDGEKLGRMVATLVIVLPSSYEGGELVIRQDGQERTIDFTGEGEKSFHIHYAAFYADCEHEIRPLKKGYRLCLVYNLTLAKSRSRKPISVPNDAGHLETIGRLLREWSKRAPVHKLAIPLEHRYTREGLTWDALKGIDRNKARILQEAASQASCKAFLAILTLWESGAAEEPEWGSSSYGGSRRWYNDEDEEDESDEDEGGGSGQYVMEEVFDSRLSASGWCDAEGHVLPIGELSVSEDEVVDPDSLKDVTPEEEYEGYTGNEGMTLDRWYRHAAIILWPERSHFEMICDRDSRAVVPELKDMVARWRRSKGEHAQTLKEQGTKLAAAILTKWPEIPFARDADEGSPAGDLLEALAALEDSRLIGVFLSKVMVRDVSADPDAAVVTACRAQGWSTFQKPLQALMKATTSETIERNARLLEGLCTAKVGKKDGRVELCRALGRCLIPAIEAADQSRSSTDWRSREVNRADVLAGLARALIATEQEDMLSRFLTHALNKPKTYPLTTAQVTALGNLRPWLKKNLKKPSPALTRWLASCREQLERLTAREPQEPTDLRRAAHVTCKCADCAELTSFLEDPQEAVHRFRLRKDRRDHLERQIRDHRLDLDPTTDRSGSPQTLVCSKNKASYREKLKTYHQNQENLAMVRTIADSLPD